ncbi:ATP-binding protein [Amycolatopsis sp. NPDC059021]|uniref:ATP-binding protein n=1 Tax=Amycolatopsis sp. NPDC059021 TaxID=3346704 RepID=UPI00366DA6C0
MNDVKPRARKVLTALLTSPNQRMPLKKVVEWVWCDTEQLPQDTRSTMHQYVTQLRRALAATEAPARLIVANGGCTLEADTGLIDYFVFRSLMNRARDQRDRGNHRSAHADALAAVQLRRDEPLADLSTELADEWRANWTRTDWIPANVFLVGEQLADGRPGAALARLTELEHSHPRELGLAKLRLRALHALERFTEATHYYVTTHRELRAAGDDRAADELRAFHDRIAYPASEPVTAASRHGTTTEPEPEPEPVPGVRRLPPDTVEIAGRDHILDTLDALTTGAAGAPRPVILTLTGSPGVGKTTVAAHWAHRAKPRYPHGVVLLDLHGYGQAPRLEAADVVDTLLAILGYPVDQIIGPVGRATKLTALLARRPLLLILDNVEDSAHVEPLLSVVHSCTVVITSRRRLVSLSIRHTVRVVTITALTMSESRALLARRIGPRAAKEPEGLDQLARLCHRLPLALTIVAERAAARTGTRLETLATQLRDAETLLTIGEDGDGAGTSLQSAFVWSYRALPPAEQRVFCLIGLNPGTELTSAALAAADGRDVAQVRRSLDVLVAAHLVRQPGDLDRYQIHDLLHLYAATLAKRLPDLDAARERMVSFYLWSVFNAHSMMFPHKARPPMPSDAPRVEPIVFADANAAARWCLQERSNINAMVPLAAENRLHDLAWRLPALTTPIMDRSGFYEDIVANLMIAARSAAIVGALEAQASTLNDLGKVHMLIGNDHEADHYLQQAHDLATAHRLEYGLLAVSLNMARRHYHAGRPLEAVAQYRISLELTRAGKYPDFRAHAAHGLADALVNAGRNEFEVYELYCEALRVRQTIGDVSGQITTRTALGSLLTRLGRYEEADRHCRIASELADTARHLPSAMKLKTVRALLAHAQRDDATALRYAGEAVELAERSRHATGQARALSVLGEILSDHGNAEDACRLWRKAVNLFRNRERHKKADLLEAKLVALESREDPTIPGARKAEEDTVAMPPPRVRLERRHHTL